MLCRICKIQDTHKESNYCLRHLSMITRQRSELGECIPSFLQELHNMQRKEWDDEIALIKTAQKIMTMKNNILISCRLRGIKTISIVL